MAKIKLSNAAPRDMPTLKPIMTIFTEAYICVNIFDYHDPFVITDSMHQTQSCCIYHGKLKQNIIAYMFSAVEENLNI